MFRRNAQEPLKDRLTTSTDTPSHPKLTAALLMAGVVLFIVLVSLAPLL